MATGTVVTPAETAGTSSLILPGFRFCSERERAPWICCAPCSAAMALGWSDPTLPVSLAEAHRLRAAVGDPHSASMSVAESLQAGGMNPGQVATAMRTRRPEVAVRMHHTAGVLARVRASQAVVVALAYGLLPPTLRRWQPGFTGGHSAVLCGTRGSLIGWWDPLAPPGWGGEWVAWEEIKGALWSGAVHISTEAQASITGTVTVRTDAPHAAIKVDDGTHVPIGGGATKTVFLRCVITSDHRPGATAYLCSLDFEAALLLASDVTANVAPCGSPNTDARDAEWREWMLAGSPGYED